MVVMSESLRPSLSQQTAASPVHGAEANSRPWRFARVLIPTLSIAICVIVGYLTVVAMSHSELRAPRPGFLLVDTDGEFLANFESPDRAAFGYWPALASAPRVERATLALEDRRFARHLGVDVLALGRALVQNLQSGRRISGGSTIAMQVARMQRPGPRTYWRKIEEIAVALALTARHGRAALLRHYLTIVPYGNRLHGTSAAARLYLNKPVADLSWAEIAFLSSIPQSPALHNPYRANGRKRIVARARQALAQLRETGTFDEPELRSALRQLALIQVRPPPERPHESLHWVLNSKSRLRLNEAAAPAGVVKSAIDSATQAMAFDVIHQHLPEWRESGADNAAAVVVDLQNAAIRAWIGSNGYTSSSAGAIDFVRTHRSPGSTLKPFIYALALERGALTPDSVLLDSPAASGTTNADRGFLGSMLPRQALANSRNLPAVRVLSRVGLDTTYWMLNRLGLHDAGRRPDHYGLGMALGALPTSLERLVGAYVALANDGIASPLRWFEHEPRARQRVLSQSSSRLITQFLSDSQARLPTFQRMGNTDMPGAVALKTGTSQGFRDAWTVAWNPRYLVGVWVGRADARPMHALGGARSAAAARALLLKLPATDAVFPPPMGYTLTKLCAQTGAAVDINCARPTEEWLVAPPRRSSFTNAVIDTRTSRRATPQTPARYLHVQPRRALEASLAHGNAAPVVASPPDGLRLLRIPGVPAKRQTIALRTRVVGAPLPVVWYVDGQVWRQTHSDEEIRWPMELGRHRFAVAAAGQPPTSSVTVWVQ
ncbi:MAG: glycosyl transferase [Chromatiales bacterium]|jgi:penicillin-binding protein 1C|nr:glycosyl transferase [Chromatiales bacterium]